MTRPRHLLALLLVVLPGLAAAQSPADTSRGDKQLAAYFDAQTRQIAATCLADVKTLADWQKKRPELRRQFLDMLGLWPLPARTDLKVKVTGKIDAEHYTLEKLHYQSSPGLYVSANLYVPKKAKFPAPAVLYVCGHGGTKIDGVNYGNHVYYQHHPAWFAEHGYVCLILDTLQLGEVPGLHHGTFANDKGLWWWQTLGYTPAGIECWNAMRALDYLESRKDVDPKRLGVTGRSGGGATSWWLAAADERVQCIIPVAGIADLRAHLVEGVAPRFRNGVISGHCDCMYMVNTYRWDFSVVAALCAPRPLLLGNSDADDIFPVAGYRRLAEPVRRIYDLYGAKEKFALLETAGPHKDTPELRLGAFRWMNRWLKNEPGEVTEEKRPLWTPQQLKVFDRAPEDARNAFIHEVFIKPARPLLPQSAEVVKSWWPGKRQEWLQTLKDQVFRGWAQKPPPVNARLAVEVVKQGVRLRAFDFVSEQGVELRLFVLTAEKNAKPSVTVLHAVDEAGWRAWVAELGPDFRAALQLTHEPKFVPKGLERVRRVLETTKWALATVSPRGVGPTRWKEAGTATENQVKRRFPLIGQTLDGQRVWDVRRSLAALRQVPGLKGVPLWLQGEGALAGIVLYAALFESDVARLKLRHLPPSHLRGPTFLNVRKHFDLPQALALALPRSIDLTVPTADFAQFDWALRLQKSLGLNSLKIRTATD